MGIVTICIQMYTPFFKKITFLFFTFTNIKSVHLYIYKCNIKRALIFYPFLLKIALMARRGNKKDCPPLKVALSQKSLVKSKDAKLLYELSMGSGEGTLCKCESLMEIGSGQKKAQ